MFESICETIHREMDKLEKKYSSGAQLSNDDLEDIDKMAHALKSLKAYEAMAGSSEYGGGSYEGGSYARGRSRATGRYVSRDESPYDPRISQYGRY